MLEPYTGMIKLFPYSFIPDNWLECSGQTLSISTNQPLFSVIGTRFGGDGITNFKLPDLRNAIPYPGAEGQKQYAYCIATSGIYPQSN